MNYSIENQKHLIIGGSCRVQLVRPNASRKIPSVQCDVKIPLKAAQGIIAAIADIPGEWDFVSVISEAGVQVIRLPFADFKPNGPVAQLVGIKESQPQHSSAMLEEIESLPHPDAAKGVEDSSDA